MVETDERQQLNFLADKLVFSYFQRLHRKTSRSNIINRMLADSIKRECEHNRLAGTVIAQWQMLCGDETCSNLQHVGERKA